MRIVALDIVRFIAALSVVLYHYISRPSSDAYPLISEVTKFGYLGVPLFFIISGYVISLSAENRTALQFGISRFVRLYPALWIGVLFTALTLSILTENQYTIAQILANFTLLNEYFGYEDIDGVYWTLKAELKFYACIFILILFGVIQKYRIWLTIWLGLTGMHAVMNQPFFMGWFISPGYSSFFIGGIACFLIQKEGKNRFNISVFMLSLVISSFNAYHQASGFLINPDIIDRLISVFLIWSFYLLFYFLCIGKLDISGNNIFLVLGALTYPLYLIHNYAGKAIIDYCSGVIPEEIMIVIVFAFMLVVSFIIYRYYEKKVASPMKEFLLSQLSVFDKNGKVKSRIH